jgi:thiamine biosynthesis lipoprotein
MLVVLQGCNRSPQGRTVMLSGPTMGTSYKITIAINDGNEFNRDALQKQVLNALTDIDKEMSAYRPDSDLTRFNNSTSTDWFPVSPDLVKVIDAAEEISTKTNGAFDVTVAPLVDLWGFGPNSKSQGVPIEAQIAASRQRVGYTRLHTRMQPPALRKDIPDLQVDVNAIAPGYAIDMLASLIEAQGYKNYLVDLGGESYAKGHKPDGNSWKIGVENPTSSVSSIRKIVALDGEAISTAGDYREYFEVDGKRYSHIIDPKTGSPITHNVASVSVIATTAMNANGWDTALMAMGPAGLKLARQLHIPAAFIFGGSDNFRLESTTEFGSRVVSGATSP